MYYILWMWLRIKTASECSQDEIKKYIRGKNQVSAIDTIKSDADRHSENVEREIECMRDNGIHLCSKWDDEYPKGYQLLKDAPLFIYTKGNPDLLNWEDSIAIVGTRDCLSIYQ